MNASMITAVSLVSSLPRSSAKAGGPVSQAPSLLAGAGGTTAASSAGLLRLMSPGTTESLFSVNNSDVTRQKIKLMERVGKAFGVPMDDFRDMKSFGQAIREKMATMDTVTLKVMEASLGLPKLGVSLIDVVDAMQDPGGAADDRLDTALRRHAKETDADETPSVLDEIGRYGIDAARRRDR